MFFLFLIAFSEHQCHVAFWALFVVQMKCAVKQAAFALSVTRKIVRSNRANAVSLTRVNFYIFSSNIANVAPLRWPHPRNKKRRNRVDL